MKYLEWNDAIASYFFNENKSGQRMWFSAEKDLIGKIAKENNTTFEEFIKVVKLGPDEIKNDLKQNNVCKKAHKIFKKWESDKSQFKYPPYTAYLALFVLAVSHGRNNEDFSEIAYYPRLNELIGENLSTQDFKNIPDLWEDLEKWTLEDKQGGFGEFHLDIYGGRLYVGILYYQVVLTKEDQQHLPEIFWKMGWDSDSIPTEAEILQALKRYKQKLSNRTQKRIEKGRLDFRSQLCNRFLEELKNYDEDQIEETSAGRHQKRGQILICLNDIDQTAKTVKVSFRCKKANGLPDEDFILKNENKEWQVPPPSSTISGFIQEFSIKDWAKDFSASITDDNKYHFHYKGEKYKIFTKGSELEVDGWVSGQRYTPDELFYLAVHSDLVEKVQRWGQKECDKFQKLNDFTGLPTNWHLFKIKGVKNDSLIKDSIPALAIDEHSKIHFEGGIRLSKGNQFFDFALPQVKVIGCRDQDPETFYKVNNEEKKLIPSGKSSYSFLLPKDIPYNERIKIILKGSDSRLPTKSHLMLVKTQLEKFNEYSNGYAMDRFGNLKEENENNQLLQGTYGPYLQHKEDYTRFPNIELPTYGKIYWIGDTPGQTSVSWTDLKWTANWMIHFKTHKKAIVYYMGQETNSPDKIKDNFSKNQIKLWKKVVWHSRKRIQINPQSKKSDKQKWKDFLKGINYV